MGLAQESLNIPLILTSIIAFVLWLVLKGNDNEPPTAS